MKKNVKSLGTIFIVIIGVVVGFIIYSNERSELIESGNNKRLFYNEEYKDIEQIKEDEMINNLPVDITSKFEMYSKYVTIYKDRKKVRTYRNEKLVDIAQLCQKYYDKFTKNMYMSQNGPYIITELGKELYEEYKGEFYSYPNSWDKDYDIRIIFENNSAMYINSKNRNAKVFKMYNEVHLGKLSKKEYEIIAKFLY